MSTGHHSFRARLVKFRPRYHQAQSLMFVRPVQRTFLHQTCPKIGNLVTSRHQRQCLSFVSPAAGDGTIGLCLRPRSLTCSLARSSTVYAGMPTAYSTCSCGSTSVQLKSFLSRFFPPSLCYLSCCLLSSSGLAAYHRSCPCSSSACYF